MKSSILGTMLLTVMLGVSISANAQFTYGLRTGLNYSAQASMGKLNDGENFKAGFTIGAKAGYQLNKVLLLGTELNYQNKGGDLTMNIDDATKTITRKADYLSVPVLLTAAFGEQLSLKPEWKVYGTVGPYYSWLLNVSDFDGGTDVSSKTNIENSASNTDWGLVYGLGASYDLGSSALFAEIRYDMGFAKVVDYNSDIRNKSFGLTVGLNF